MKRLTYEEFIHLMAQQMATAEVAVRSGKGRQAGMALVAAQYGLLDRQFIPMGGDHPFVLASGHSNPKCIDGPQAQHTMHRLDYIPRYEDIPACVADIVQDGNKVMRLRAMGIVVEDKAAKRLSIAITGCVYALTLYHLWNGDDVRRMRFRTLKRKAGPVFVNNPKWRHHSLYRPYWRLAWAMHADGELHANLCAYLNALCTEYRNRTDHNHSGYRVWMEVQRLMAARDSEFDEPEWTEADAAKEQTLNQRSAS